MNVLHFFNLSPSVREINEAVVERQRTLAAALQHRRDFYSRLGDTEKWIKKIRRKLDSGNEIYSDEVADTRAKLKVSWTNIASLRLFDKTQHSNHVTTVHKTVSNGVHFGKRTRTCNN